MILIWDDNGTRWPRVGLSHEAWVMWDQNYRLILTSGTRTNSRSRRNSTDKREQPQREMRLSGSLAASLAAKSTAFRDMAKMSMLAACVLMRGETYLPPRKAIPSPLASSWR